VRDNQGATSDPVTVRIDVGNTPPTPTITSPSASKRFRVGEQITLQGSATDAQDGTLANSALSWRVILHHNNHTHPYLQPTAGNTITFTAPAPEDLAATETSYVEIELTATDLHGLTSVITQQLLPKKVNVTFETIPSGLQVEVNGTGMTGPHTLVSWEAYKLNVNAPAQADASDQRWTFASWSDGGAAAHTITTPASATTYTATYRAANLLKNFSFEADANGDTFPDSWTTNTAFTRSAATAPHHGTYVGRFASTGNADITSSQTVTNLTAGTTYAFSGWVQIPATSDAFTFRLQVSWRNASNSTIRTDTITSYADDTAGAWNQAMKSLVAPTGTTNAQVRMVVSSLNGTIYVDDFVFKP
jgi:hypothetical protein